jgi:hypothetical protein
MFGSIEKLSHLREIIFSSKQLEGELLIKPYERFGICVYGTKHGLWP